MYTEGLHGLSVSSGASFRNALRMASARMVKIDDPHPDLRCSTSMHGTEEPRMSCIYYLARPRQAEGTQSSTTRSD